MNTKWLVATQSYQGKQLFHTFDFKADAMRYYNKWLPVCYEVHLTEIITSKKG